MATTALTDHTNTKHWPKSLPHQTRFQECLHEPSWDIRETIILALHANCIAWYQAASRRLASCATGASFFVDPDAGKVRPWISHCRHRMCPFCGRGRSAHVADQIHAAMNHMRHPRLIVLTIASRTAPLAEQLADLRNNLAKLRRYKRWKEYVTGGIYTLEVTRNQDTGLWHPHVHMVVDGVYFPQKSLRFLWHRATGSAKIVWIADVHDRRGASIELAKYVGKPQHVHEMPPSAICEYARATNGTRMVQTFGNLYGQLVKDRDPAQPDAPRAYRVPLSRLVRLANLGFATPQRLLVTIAKRWPRFSSYIYHELPQLEPPPTAADRTRRMLRVLVRGPPHEARRARAPPPAGSGDPIMDDREKKDVLLFLAFNCFRQEDNAHEYLHAEQQAAASYN